MPDKSSMLTLDWSDARLLAATLDVAKPPEPGSRLPPCWHWIYLRPDVATSALREDGHASDVAPHPDVSDWTRVWGAGVLTWHDDLRIGETLSYEWAIKDVKMKAGRSGRLCVCDVAHRWARGEHLVLEESQTLVYREPESVERPHAELDGTSQFAPPPPQARAGSSWEHCFTEIELFRYSALTFNSHRIHYDVNYARTVEKYPGLVVHGPLLATVATNFAERMSGGRGLARFAYRLVAPVFSGDRATFSFDLKSDEVIASSRGRPVLVANCTFRSDSPAILT